MAVPNDELAALLRVRTFGKAMMLFYLILIVMALIYYGYAISAALSATPYSGAFNLAYVSLALVAALIFVYVYAVLKIRKAFFILSSYDKKFDRPLLLVNIMIVAMVGAVLLLLFGSVVSSLYTMAVGALLLVGGYIVGVWGMALGLWRFGSKHKDPIIKVGSIIWVFSGFPGVILVYLGACGVQASLSAPRPRRGRPAAVPT